MANSLYLVLVILLLNIMNSLSQSLDESSYNKSCEVNSCLRCFNRLAYETVHRDQNQLSLQRAFYPPDRAPPVFVIVTYNYSDPNGNILRQSKTWFWSASTYYIYQPLAMLQFTSLFFADPDFRTERLTIILPTDCINVNDTTMQLLTQRLQLFAQSRNIFPTITSDYQPKAESGDTLNKYFSNYRDPIKYLFASQFMLYFMSFFVTPFIILYLLYGFPFNLKEDFLESKTTNKGNWCCMCSKSTTNNNEKPKWSDICSNAADQDSSEENPKWCCFLHSNNEDIEANSNSKWCCICIKTENKHNENPNHKWWRRCMCCNITGESSDLKPEDWEKQSFILAAGIFSWIFWVYAVIMSAIGVSFQAELDDAFKDIHNETKHPFRLLYGITVLILVENLCTPLIYYVIYRIMIPIILIASKNFDNSKKNDNSMKEKSVSKLFLEFTGVLSLSLPFTTLAVHFTHIMIGFIHNEYHATSVAFFYGLVITLNVIMFTVVTHLYYSICVTCCKTFSFAIFGLIFSLASILLNLFIAFMAALYFLLPINNAFDEAPDRLNSIISGIILVFSGYIVFWLHRIDSHQKELNLQCSMSTSQGDNSQNSAQAQSSTSQGDNSQNSAQAQSSTSQGDNSQNSAQAQSSTSQGDNSQNSAQAQSSTSQGDNSQNSAQAQPSISQGDNSQNSAEAQSSTSQGDNSQNSAQAQSSTSQGDNSQNSTQAQPSTSQGDNSQNSAQEQPSTSQGDNSRNSTQEQPSTSRGDKSQNSTQAQPHSNF